MIPPVDRPDDGPLKVVILAGGYGTRLAERTDELPKPMVEIGGRPILWHILKGFGHQGFDDFLVACGYRGEVIKRFFLEYRLHANDLLVDLRRQRVEQLSDGAEPWRVALVDTGEGTQTGGRLRRLGGHLDGPRFLMTYGDGVSDVDVPRLVAFHRAHGRLATFTAVRPPARFGRPILEGDRAVGFEEKVDAPDEWISAGYFVLEREVVDLVGSDDTSFEADTLPRLAEAGELMAFKHEGFWQPMDTLRDVRKLDALARGPDAPWMIWT